MLAQFAAGLIHFSDYKRCKLLGDMLGVNDVTKPPPLDHRSARFLFKFLAELRAVRKSEGALVQVRVSLKVQTHLGV